MKFSYIQDETTMTQSYVYILFAIIVVDTAVNILLFIRNLCIENVVT